MLLEEAQVESNEKLDLEALDRVLDAFREERGAIIPILQRTQELYGYLPAEALRRISQRTGYSVAELYGVATFYAQFYLEPRGRHILSICDGTACHVKGAPQLVAALEEELGVKAGGTTSDSRVTFQVVFCLGACALAPMAIIDGQVVGRLSPDKVQKLVRELE